MREEIKNLVFFYKLAAFCPFKQLVISLTYVGLWLVLDHTSWIICVIVVVERSGWKIACINACMSTLCQVISSLTQMELMSTRRGNAASYQHLLYRKAHAALEICGLFLK